MRWSWCRTWTLFHSPFWLNLYSFDPIADSQHRDIGPRYYELRRRWLRGLLISCSSWKYIILTELLAFAHKQFCPDLEGLRCEMYNIIKYSWIPVNSFAVYLIIIYLHSWILFGISIRMYSYARILMDRILIKHF